jgi:hypothetical protein
VDKETAQIAMWYGLTFLLVLGGLAGSYALWRLGRLLREVQETVHEATDEAVPLIGKAGESLDTVNDQLKKVDLMMDSAVDAVEAADVAVRAVSIAVTEPVKMATGAVAGVTEALTSFRQRVADPLDDDDADDSIDSEPLTPPKARMSRFRRGAKDQPAGTGFDSTEEGPPEDEGRA